MSAERNDRAAGAVLGMAAGDALGAGYEFGPPLADDVVVAMQGGGGLGWAPREWTDDTSMAVSMLRAAAADKRLIDEATQDSLVATWADWARSAPDVSTQTRAVLAGKCRSRRWVVRDEGSRSDRIELDDRHSQLGGALKLDVVSAISCSAVISDRTARDGFVGTGAVRIGHDAQGGRELSRI